MSDWYAKNMAVAGKMDALFYNMNVSYNNGAKHNQVVHESAIEANNCDEGMLAVNRVGRNRPNAQP